MTSSLPLGIKIFVLGRDSQEHKSEVNGLTVFRIKLRSQMG